jgi:hypothetical protein
MTVSVTELPGATLNEEALGAMVTDGGGAWATEKIRFATLLPNPRELLVYAASMVCDPIASGFEIAGGSVATPEEFTWTAGWTAPSTVKTTEPVGTKVPEVPSIVALTAVEPTVGVATFIVVVVATVSPAPPANCTVWVTFVFRLLSVMLAVPVMLAAVEGEKSTTRAQLAPDANVACWDPPLSWGQVVVLSRVKPLEMLGFCPDAGAGKARGALPVFVTVTIWSLAKPICAPAKVRLLAETFTSTTPLPE